MKKKQFEKEMIEPDQVILTKIQATRLAALADVDIEEISGKNIAQLTDLLRWRVDPRIFRFKRICGKVVKKDPVTGIEYPVPFATVYVEDTDCSLFLFQPKGFPWSWHFPFNCHREVIAKTHTDACGNWCVWVPRFDIDWVKRWRKHRVCFPYIFRRPVLKDLIKLKWPPIPNPPDPGPWEEVIKINPGILNSLGGAKAEMLKKQIAKMENALPGANAVDSEEFLNQSLFDHEMSPPLPQDYQNVISGHNIIASKNVVPHDAIRTDLASKLGLNVEAKELASFDHLNFRGPFYRCYDFYVPVWQLILDVPDITFRVTQDVNGDGIEETIYSEGYFRVRWDAGTLPNMKLVASHIARESHACHVPLVPCGNVPAIKFAGLMPLQTPEFDVASGYALGANRPIPTGIPGDTQVAPARTPFCQTLQLYGCVNIQGAVDYRIRKLDPAPNGVAINGLPAWNNYDGSTPIPIVANSEGWYPVNPVNPFTLAAVPRASLAFPYLILNWPTPQLEKSNLVIDVRDGAGNIIATSAAVAIVSDNTPPVINVTKLSWKKVGEPDSALRNLKDINCPVIQRGAATQSSVEVVFEVFVSANHLRDAYLGTQGCGDGVFVPIGPINQSSHWHRNGGDNTAIIRERYLLDAGSAQGSYSFHCNAYERSINPDGHDNGLSFNWIYNHVEIGSHHEVNVAVVNEDL
ncbi:MAG: hypothetical protein ABI772_07080 [Bacteroidota bacterium]